MEVASIALRERALPLQRGIQFRARAREHGLERYKAVKRIHFAPAAAINVVFGRIRVDRQREIRAG